MLAVGLTDRGRALRARAERIPPAIVERLGMPVADLEAMREVLNEVIAATRLQVRPARDG
jgi:MarR family transcriptional regulator, organic hydroperoxide resistance regulator